MSKTFSKLSRPAIRKLVAGRKISEQGIVFERLKNGDGLYSINVMVDGQRIHRVIGRESDGTTRTHAADFIEKVRRDAREGRLNLPKGRKVALVFEKACDDYLEKLKAEGGSDIAKKEERLELHLTPFFKGKPISRITNFDVERFKKSRKDEGAAQTTINRELAVLSHLLNKAIEWGWIDQKPAKIKRYKEGSNDIVYLTKEQADRLLISAKENGHPVVYPFVMIGLNTGMRRMEILSIKLENIDLNLKVIFIPNAKAGPRSQPITESLADFLVPYVAKAKPGQVWLFPAKRSKTGHTMSIEKPYRAIVKSAGLNSREIVRHTLRHTAITQLVQSGVDLPTVQRISGHKTIQMVLRYAHQNGAHIRSAMGKLEQRYKITGARLF